MEIIVDNVIPAFFGDEVYNDVYTLIKHGGGVLKAEESLIKSGYHPSFAKAVVKKIMRERGW